METLVSLIPDVEVFLALAPEELAPILLRLARRHMQGGSFLPEQVTPTATFDRVAQICSCRIAVLQLQATRESDL
jgi:hypothetical protein